MTKLTSNQLKDIVARRHTYNGREALDMLLTLILNMFSRTEIENRTGWAAYTDTVLTSGSPLTLVANTETVLTNNKGTSLESQMPDDVTTFYDGTRIQGFNGDDIIIGIRFKAVPRAAGTTYVDVRVNIDGAPGVIYEETKEFPKGQGTERSVNVTFSGYSLGTFEANGAEILVESNGALDIYDVVCIVKRTHKAKN